MKLTVQNFIPKVMEIIADANISKYFSDKYVYFDNDFLSLCYKNFDVYSFAIDFLSNSTIFIDPFTRFEFLRGIFVPQEKDLMEKFVNNADIFTKPISHNDIFQKIQNNALQLSLTYSHEGRTSGVSLVDLLLAGRIMYQSSNDPILITGNKKDFPSCIFDTVTVINIEQSDGNMRSFCAIKFNQQKFDKCQKKLLY